MTATTEPKATPAQRPAHLTFDSFPQHARLSGRVTEMQTRLNAVRAKLRSAMRAEERTPAAATARRLIDADALPDRIAGSPVIEQSEAARLFKEQRILEDAVKMAEDQLRLMESQLSFQCCTAELTEWHKGLIAEMARRLVEVVMLARIEEAALDAMRMDGIEPRLCPYGGAARPMFLGSLSTRPGEAGSTRVWLDSLVEMKLLTGKEDWLVEFLTSEAEPMPLGKSAPEVKRPLGTLLDQMQRQLMKRVKSMLR